jgi:hypothetical protein
MGDANEIGEDRLRSAIRTEVASIRRRARSRAVTGSPDEARARTWLRRQAWSRSLREGRAELAAMEPEIDRMLRLDDRFSAWLRKRRD